MKSPITPADLAALLGDLPDLISPRDFCRVFGVTRRTLHSWMKRPDFPPPLRLGACTLRWPRSVLLRWMEGRARQKGVPA
jgi:prophage regulatory protein